MKKLLMVFLAIGLVATMAAPSLANIAIDFTNYTNSTSGDFCLGFKFSTNVPVNVTDMGYYDFDQDGLTLTHAVGIYDAAGNLLVQTTVSNDDALNGNFRFHALTTPLLLGAGQTYYIEAVATTSDPYVFYATDLVWDSSINFISDASYDSITTTLNFPNLTYGLNGFFGPNFLLTPVEVVPLPASVLLLGSGLLSLAGWRRFRKS